MNSSMGTSMSSMQIDIVFLAVILDITIQAKNSFSQFMNIENTSDDAEYF